MKLIVTVDTEADDQWNEQAGLSVENVYALPRFQALCEKYAVVPTYFVTYEVAADLQTAALLREWQDKGAGEVGAHLHPWTTPPLEAGEGNSRAFPSELSDEKLRAKLTVLTEKIGSIFGRRPTSYRAGRWGFDARQAALLKELGYVFDSSITPRVSWKKSRGALQGHGGPDFTKENAIPHMLNGQVLEVPMTILRAGFFRRLRWLRIFENTTKRDLENVIGAAERMRLPAVVFMIHSSELVAGKSPYVKDERALARVYARLEELFALCKEKGIASVTASAFAQEFHA